MKIDTYRWIHPIKPTLDDDGLTIRAEVPKGAELRTAILAFGEAEIQIDSRNKTMIPLVVCYFSYPLHTETLLEQRVFAIVQGPREIPDGACYRERSLHRLQAVRFRYRG